MNEEYIEQDSMSKLAPTYSYINSPIVNLTPRLLWRIFYGQPLMLSLEALSITKQVREEIREKLEEQNYSLTYPRLISFIYNNKPLDWIMNKQEGVNYVKR